MRNRSVVLFSILLLAILLTACGGQSGQSGPTEVNVTLSEFKLEMDKTSIPAGPVVFKINNAGTLTHEVVLEKAGQPDTPFEEAGEVSEAEDIEAGKSATLEWTIDEPGEYQLACHVDENDIDHYGQGMVLTFTVTGN